jgi:hypothetical protein
VTLDERISMLSPIRDWFFDTETLLPVRVEDIGRAAVTTSLDYRHTAVNQPIPDNEFKPESGPDLKSVAAEPLKEGYTTRFLNVMDGSNGRMSVRWGMQGPKGTSSSGLN